MPERPERTSVQSWIVVAVGFVALSVAFSARSSLGLTMPVWEAELGWSRGFVSTGGALTLVVMAAVAPFAGNLVDRHGPRLLLGGGLLAVGLGMALTAAMTAPWMFLAAFALLGGLGFGVVANHVVATAVAGMFERNRGLAVGIATSGATAGQLAVVPLLALVMGGIGWRVSFAVLAGVILALVPVVLLAIRQRPQQRPAARAAARPPHAPHGAAVPAGEAAAASLRTRLGFLMRSPVFQALFWSFTICGFTTAGTIEMHLLPYAAACGFPPLPSATAYGVLSAFNLLGMVLAGYLADRMHRPGLLAGIYLLRAASFILLLFVAYDLKLLFVFAVVFGLFDYSTVPVTASLVASHLGLRVMGLAMGLAAAGHALGAAAGAFMGGYFYDRTAAYDWVWLTAFALAVLAALLALTIRETRGRRQAEAPALAAAQ